MNDTAPVFRPLLVHAWRISWQYPWLICFGFLASFLSLGGFWEFLFQSQSAGGVAARIAIAARALIAGDGGAFFRGLGETVLAAPGTFMVLVLLVLFLIGAIFFILAIAALAYGTIIDATHKITLARRTTFRAAWAIGRRFALTVLGIHVIIKIIITILFLIAGLFLQATFATRGIFFFLDFIIFVGIVAVSLTASLTTMYAVSYAVLRGFTIRESLYAATRLFVRHWLISLECATLFFLLSFALGIATLAVTIYLFQPILQLSLVLASAAIAGSAPFVMTLWALVVLVLFIGVASFFTMYQTITWTLLFLRLTEQGATPKLIRIFHRNTQSQNQMTSFQEK